MYPGAVVGEELRSAHPSWAVRVHRLVPTQNVRRFRGTGETLVVSGAAQRLDRTSRYPFRPTPARAARVPMRIEGQAGRGLCL